MLMWPLENFLNREQLNIWTDIKIFKIPRKVLKNNEKFTYLRLPSLGSMAVRT